MIEFKADCGHTVRAKDEDAGRVVRCAYCGREAKVPDDDSNDFDMLFADIEASTSGAPIGQSPSGGRKRGRRVEIADAKRRLQRTDPFNVITKMAYVAAILIAVIFVAKWAYPLARDTYSKLTADKPAEDTPSTQKNEPKEKAATKSSSKRVGLIRPNLARRGKEGVYATAVPGSAMVYHRRTESMEKGGRESYDWLADPQTERVSHLPAPIDLAPGMHDLVMVIPINDPQLNDYEKRGLAYFTFRKEVREELFSGKSAAAKTAATAADEYFLPDGAISVGVKTIGGVNYLLRHYKVNVRPHEWQVLTSLFIPEAIALKDVITIVPREKNYGFDDGHVTTELTNFFEVPEVDASYVRDVLHRIGMFVYRFEDVKDNDRRYQLFRIDHQTGHFIARFLGDVREPASRGSRRH